MTQPHLYKMVCNLLMDFLQTFTYIIPLCSYIYMHTYVLIH